MKGESNIGETTTYMLNDQDGDKDDCFNSLAALKKYADTL